MLCGPTSARDRVPSGKDGPGAIAALQAIHQHGLAFHSRDDGSATNIKEQQLWLLAGLKPFDTPTRPPFYTAHNIFPAEALLLAGAEDAFLLVDWCVPPAQTALIGQGDVAREPGVVLEHVSLRRARGDLGALTGSARS